jgi:hypothetical protein
MMHPTLFEDSQEVVDFCKTHNLRYLAKPLDGLEDEWAYSKDQFKEITKQEQVIKFVDKKVVSIEQGRMCCGGRLLSVNNNLRSRETFVPRQGFEGWQCSVNWFFLFVRQFDGAVYTNKDCKTSTTGAIEPLGNLSNATAIIDTLKQQFENGMPIINCVKPICRCGFCAPKAETKEEFLELINRTTNIDIFKTKH